MKGRPDRAVPLIWAIGFALLSMGCGAALPTSPEPRSSARDDRLDAILWQTTSAEYHVLAKSIYAAAQSHLERALADPQWSALPTQQENSAGLPPALIMDVDETVIDTGEFQSSLVKNRARFSSRPWREWQMRNVPKAVPGAVEFIAFAQARGVTVFFVTNRDSATEATTRKNLTSLGIQLPDHIDTVLTRGERPDWNSDKESRRRLIARNYRVIMLVGDDLSDFISEYRIPPLTRISEAAKYSHWGSKWFMLPNPMYGSWEASLYDFDAKLNAEAVSQRKHQQLR
jgi:acid phosphatase